MSEDNERRRTRRNDLRGLTCIVMEISTTLSIFYKTVEIWAESQSFLTMFKIKPQEFLILMDFFSINLF